MKRCPECRRDYFDDSLTYCLDDGGVLLQGPSHGSGRLASLQSPEGQETAILSNAEALSREHQGDRFGSPDETTAETKKTIAVLPFTHLSSDPDDEYFCDGLAEELLNALARIEDLKVTARSTSFAYRNRQVSVGEIARALGVGTILEGSVRKSGNRLRITVQLINAADDFQIWSDRYDREMSDIFDVQDEITVAVVEALKIKLFASGKKIGSTRHTENTEAYKLFLKGRYLRHTKNDHAGALEAFSEAVRLDPNHALSWGGVAEASVLSAHYGHIFPRDAIAKARSALEKVKKLSGESAVTIYVEAFIAYIERDWAGIDATYRRAAHFRPPHPNTRGTFGIIQAVAGRRKEAALLLDESIAADPLAAFPYAAKGIGQAAMRENVESLDSFEQAFALEPDHLLALWGYCCVKVGIGDFDQGIAAAERALTLSKRSSFFVGLIGWALAEAGRPEEATDLLAELRANGGPSVVTEGWLLAALDEKDEAFEALSRAEEELHPFVCYLGLPSFDKLRGDPRFSELASRLGVPGYTSSL